MIGREEFNHLVREALFNLFDITTLENSPLNALFIKPVEYSGSRADFLYKLITKTIDSLRPDETSPITDVAWRPFLILSGRYIERISIQDLCGRLSLSERQIRREHARALKALSTRLWDSANPDQAFETSEEGLEERRALETNNHEFSIHIEPLNISEVLDGVIQIFNRIAIADNTPIRIEIQPDLARALADRILLRQIFFRFLRFGLDLQIAGAIRITAAQDDRNISLKFEYPIQQLSQEVIEEETEDFDEINTWLKRINASFDGVETLTGKVILPLTLQRARIPVIMVVDDQDTALRMYQRYLSQSRIKVIGINRSEEVQKAIRQYHPDVILLDVMMPTIDGWDVLLALKTSDDTRSIPVIVCSVWDEPNMAHSLGAADFLKKPISQSDLLHVLAALNILDSPA